MARVVDVYPLTHVQQGMLVQWLSMPESRFYYSHQAFELEGPFEVDLFARALEEAIARHEALRTAFSWQGMPAPVQVVVARAALPLERVDLRAAEDPDAALTELLERDAADRLDLEKPPLFRVKVVRFAAERHVVVWGFHHLVIDGWSIAILFREVMASYLGHLAGTKTELPPAPRFADYVAHAAREREQAASDAFWSDALSGVTLPTPLGIDRACAAADHGEVAIARSTLHPELAEALFASCRRMQVTPWAVVASAWGLLLSRYSGEDRVVYGTTVSGRQAAMADCEHMVGNLLTVVPVRCDVGDNPSLRELAASTHRFYLLAEKHQHTGAAEIRKGLGLPADGPLFESLVVFQNAPEIARHPGLPLSVRPLQFRDENADALTLTVYPKGPFVLQLEYRAARFETRAMTATLKRLESVLEAFARHPDRRVSELACMPNEERAQIEAWSSPRKPSETPFESMVDMLLTQVENAPNETAVVDGARRLTYAELNRQANQVANELLERGIVPGDRIGILDDGSLEGVVSVLGTSKAGAIWAPAHPEWPLARTEGMLRDLNARILLTSGAHRVLAKGLPCEIIDVEELVRGAGSSEEPSIFPDPEHRAYVISTSGSTGTPKGVVVRHGALNYVCGRWREDYRLDRFAVRLLQIGNFACDVFIGDLLKVLLAGGTLYLTRGRAALDLARTAKLLADERITVLESTPAFCVSLFDHAHQKGMPLPELRLVILGADSLRMHEYRGLLRKYGRNARIVNGYGLTEATIESSVYEETAEKQGGATEAGYAPLGVPFAGTRFFVLDAKGRRAPVGLKGELYVGGPGLAEGYWNRPELTRERFRTDLVPGIRLYRTGDLVRWTWDGCVEYAGRADHQTKIRGFRVELGEVENAILGEPGVSAAAVIVTEGAPRLLAFVVLEGELDALERGLRTRLPPAMIPSRFVALPALPLNANGKVDRTALGQWPLETPHEVAMDQGSTEAKLAALWKDVLGVAQIGMDDSFFSSGGDSVLVLRLFNRMAEAFETELTVADLFTHHTIRMQARHLDAMARPTKAANSEEGKLFDILDRLDRGAIDLQEARAALRKVK